jgi:ABC-2 type transport system permease protein
VNRHHLAAFVWLRWRLRLNQFKRGGVFNTILFALLAAGAVVLAVVLFAGGFAAGFFLLPEAPPEVRLILWDGVVLGFLFTWAIGLMSELQRTDPITPDKYLHLPVLPSGAFLVNYLSSLVSLTTVIFVPAMAGLLFGQLFSVGPVILLGFPLVAAFVLAITGLTHLLQSWLAGLMSNPRRRRTIIVLLTIGFIALLQAPNILNLTFRQWGSKEGEATTWRNEARTALQRDLNTERLTPDEYRQRMEEIDREYRERTQEESRRRWEETGRIAWVANIVLPPGWLPLGASGLPDGSVVPALLGTFGLGAIGGLSLWRAYRTVLRLYTGQDAGGEGRVRTIPAAPAMRSGRTPMIEWRLPRVSEHASAVAAAGLRSLTRAPEAKMMLIAPVVLTVVFVGLVLSGALDPPKAVRPLMALGAAAMILLIGVQLVGNQFGYDRAGFRAFVLSPIPRREILLGKNLAVAPFTLGLAAAVILVVGLAFPMRPDHYLAVAATLVSMYLVYCLLANALSIVAPIPLAPGALQPSSVKLMPMLLQMLFMFAFPMALTPVLAPLLIELVLTELGVLRGWPIALVLSLAMVFAVFAAYRKVLTWEGDWLAAREKAILEVVTAKAE